MYFDDSKSYSEEKIFSILKKMTSVSMEDRIALFQEIEMIIKKNSPTDAAKLITEKVIAILGSVRDQAAEELFEPATQAKKSPVFRRVT